MKIILKNIQSIRHAVYDLPDTGVVQVVGANSNGKSVLVKAIKGIACLEILDNDKRAALISDCESSGSITMEYKGKALVASLDRDRNNCFVGLVRANGERITRTFREKGIKELVYEFGFRTYANNAICLQICEAFGRIPFVTEDDKTNGEIVKSITEDTVARKFLDNYRDITHKAMKQQMKLYNDAIANKQRLKESIVMFDYKMYTEMQNRMQALYNECKYLDYLDLDFIQPPPNLVMYKVPTVELEEIPILPEVSGIDVEVPDFDFIQYREPMTVPEQIEDLSSIISSINEILDGRCPTCGRPLVDLHECEI